MDSTFIYHQRNEQFGRAWAVEMYAHDGNVCLSAGVGPCSFFLSLSPERAREMARALERHAEAAEEQELTA